MNNRKTALAWFNELPSPYREQAFENTKKTNPRLLLETYDRASKALMCSFMWDKSPKGQGHNYWDDIYESLCAKEEGVPEFDKSKDIINIRWDIHDVICKAEEMGLSITREQARMAMRFIEKNHDANIGVNWEVIGYAIESILK